MRNIYDMKDAYEQEIAYLLKKVDLLKMHLENQILINQDNKIHCVEDAFFVSQTKVNSLEKEIISLNKAIEAYKSSICWRITKPLRILRLSWLQNTINILFFKQN